MQGVGNRLPQVDAGIAVAVDRIGAEGGRHELHMPHRAGPRAVHIDRIDVSGIDDAQRVEQLTAKEIAAATVEGERREAGRNVVAAEGGSVVGFQPPERHQHGFRNAVLLLDRIEQRGMFSHQFLAARDPARGDTRPQIIGKRQQEFGLAAVELDHALDRRDAGQRGIQRGGGNALRRGILTECGEPIVESGMGGLRRLCGPGGLSRLRLADVAGRCVKCLGRRTAASQHSQQKENPTHVFAASIPAAPDATACCPGCGCGAAPGHPAVYPRRRGDTGRARGRPASSKCPA